MNPPKKIPWWQFVKDLWEFLRQHWQFIGYLIVGIAGALMTPLINALSGGMKGYPEEATAAGYNYLIVFGYGFVFGVFTTRILKGTMDIFMGRLEKLEKDVQLNAARLTTLPAPLAIPFAVPPAVPPAAHGVAGQFLATDRLASQSIPQPGTFSDIINIGNLDDNFVKGTDISHYEDDVDWQGLVQAGIQFVYIKSGDGLNAPDGKASDHATNAKKYNLMIGYYHFGRPYKFPGDTDIDPDAQNQASRAASILSALPPADLPFMLDLEDDPAHHWDTNLSNAEYAQWINTFLSSFIVDGKANPIIYSRKSYIDPHLPAGHNLGTLYKFWLSRYTTNYLNANPPQGWDNWVLWQFTSEGKVGTNGGLDLNIWWKDDYTATLG
jgi:lysozyme